MLARVRYRGDRGDLCQQMFFSQKVELGMYCGHLLIHFLADEMDSVLKTLVTLL